MTPYERQEKILQLLNRNNFMRTSVLSKHILVSTATIRRDLKHMEQKGTIKRVSGGAYILGNNSDLAYEYTNRISLEKKKVIANLAVNLLKDGSIVFIDASTTVNILLDRIDNFSNLTFLTNSIFSAKKIAVMESKEVYLIGGKVDKLYMHTHSPYSSETTDMYHSDITFISGRGLNSKGVSETNLNEAAIKRMFRDNTDCLVLLIDSTKMNKNYFHISMNFESIDVIISDKKLPDNLEIIALENNIRVIYE